MLRQFEQSCPSVPRCGACRDVSAAVGEVFAPGEFVIHMPRAKEETRSSKRATRLWPRGQDTACGRSLAVRNERNHESNRNSRKSLPACHGVNEPGGGSPEAQARRL